MLTVNKYELELAIDQYKLKNNETSSLSENPDGTYNYGSQTFVTRASAEWWIQQQILDHEKIMTQIRSERRMSDIGQIDTHLESLYTLFETYYNKEKGIQEQTGGAIQTVKDNILSTYAKSVPTVKIPTYDPLNLDETFGIPYFTIGEEAIPVYSNNHERVLPIPDASIETHQWTYADFGRFIQESVGSLSGGKNIIHPDIATDLARRIVQIKTDTGSGTGFMRDGKVYTNHHVVKWNSSIKVYDLVGKEIKITPVYYDTALGSSQENSPTIHDVVCLDIDETYSNEYKGTPSINIPGGYVFGIKPSVHKSIDPSKYGTDSMALWVGTFESIDDFGDQLYANSYRGNFSYRGNPNNIPGTSGSVIYYNGEAIGLNSFGAAPIFYTRPGILFGRYPIHGTVFNEGGGGGVFFDPIEAK